MKATSYALLAIPLAFAVSCKNKPATDSVPARTVFFDKSGMDTTVKPGDNFFLYANGKWLKNTEIPASETGWGSFYTLYDDNQKNLHKILDDLSAQSNPAGSNEQKVADYYTSGMDTVTIEKLGWAPLKPIFAQIDAVKDYKGLVALSADGFKTGDGFLFSFYIAPDDRISTKNAAQFGQAGLTLPNRDYYFKTDSASVKIRAEFVKYIAKMFTLTGVDAATAAKNADAIMKLETAIAGSHSTPVELRDPVKNYNKFAVADFQKQIPDIDFKDVLNRLGAKTDTVLVGQPKYYQALNGLLKTTPIDVWKTEMKFGELNGSANYLSKAFRDARFDFFGKVLSGQKQQKPRWKKWLPVLTVAWANCLARYMLRNTLLRMQKNVCSTW